MKTSLCNNYISFFEELFTKITMLILDLERQTQLFVPIFFIDDSNVKLLYEVCLSIHIISVHYPTSPTYQNARYFSAHDLVLTQNVTVTESAVSFEGFYSKHLLIKYSISIDSFIREKAKLRPNTD